MTDRAASLFGITAYAMAALLLLTGAAVWLIPYETAFNALVEATGKQHRAGEIRQTLFTPSKFFRLQIVVSSAAVVSGLLLLALLQSHALRRRLFAFAPALRALHSNFWLFFRTLPRPILFLLAAVVLFNLGSTLYYAATYAINVDEAWTFINFTRTSPFVAWSYYKAPNNHILFSILSNITFLLPIDTTLALRLWPVLFFCLSLLLFFRLSALHFSLPTSVVLTALFSFTFTNHNYGYRARGYALVLCFAVLLFVCLVRLLQTRNTDHLHGIGLASILGLFTMPSFLYPVATAFAFGLTLLVIRRQLTLARKLFTTGVVSALLVLVLYVPPIVVSGWGNIASNQWVAPIDRTTVLQQYLPYTVATLRTLYAITHDGIGFVILFLFAFPIAALRLWPERFKPVSYSWIFAVLGLTLLIPIAHSLLPFPRVWIYTTVPLTLLIGFPMDVLFSRRRSAAAGTGLNGEEVETVSKNALVGTGLLTAAAAALFLLCFEYQVRITHVYDACFKRLAEQVDLGRINSVSANNVNWADVLIYYKLAQDRRGATPRLLPLEDCSAEATIMFYPDAPFECAHERRYASDDCNIVIYTR